MGIVNVTPDSFFESSRHLSAGEAVASALAMVDSGADIIDIGGESTRPGALPVSSEEELRRTAAVISELRRQSDVFISIDTRKSEVAEKALDLGADLVNDISGLTADPDMGRLVARADAGVVLMHMSGTPETMQDNPAYEDVVVEIKDFMNSAVRRAEAIGISPDSIIVDPGIGFGKTAKHNLQILNRLHVLTELEKPILVGTSRKSFIGKVLDLAPQNRLWGTAATVVAAIFKGAHVIRVHDAKEMIQVSRMTDAIRCESDHSAWSDEVQS
jgi:dihydropteroate synthase